MLPSKPLSRKSNGGWKWEGDEEGRLVVSRVGVKKIQGGLGTKRNPIFNTSNSLVVQLWGPHARSYHYDKLVSAGRANIGSILGNYLRLPLPTAPLRSRGRAWNGAQVRVVLSRRLTTVVAMAEAAASPIQQWCTTVLVVEIHSLVHHVLNFLGG